MKKGITLLLVILLAALTSSCGRKPLVCVGEKDENSGIIVSEFDFGKCFGKYGSPRLEWVITNDSLYKVLENSLMRYSEISGCDTAGLPPIDFSKYTLLGRIASGQCQVYYKRKVIDDGTKYIYKIKVVECGICKRMGININWVLVPKLPNNYTVEFIVEGGE